MTTTLSGWPGATVSTSSRLGCFPRPRSSEGRRAAMGNERGRTDVRSAQLGRFFPRGPSARADLSRRSIAGSPHLRTAQARLLRSRAVSKRELFSVIGLLHHAATVNRPGRSFLRRLINLSMVPRNMDQYVRLNGESRADLRWWRLFDCEWNGVAFFTTLGLDPPAHRITTDASGLWGCASVWQHRWLQWRWPTEWSPVPIPRKEAFPIILALATWGKAWGGSTVEVAFDNSTVVAALNGGSSRESGVAQLARVAQ